MQQTNHTQWVQSQGLRSRLPIRKLWSLLFGIMLLVMGVLPGEVKAHEIYLHQGLWANLDAAAIACGTNVPGNGCFLSVASRVDCNGDGIATDRPSAWLKRVASHSDGENPPRSPTYNSFPFCGRCFPNHTTEPGTGRCIPPAEQCDRRGFNSDTGQCFCPIGMVWEAGPRFCVEQSCLAAASCLARWEEDDEARQKLLLEVQIPRLFGPANRRPTLERFSIWSEIRFHDNYLRRADQQDFADCIFNCLFIDVDE